MEISKFLILLPYLLNVSDGKKKPLIFHGDFAKIGKFPYTAHLGILCVDNPVEEPTPWVCGSSILNQDLLLTAAHCLETCTQETTIVVSVGHVVIMRGATTSAHSFVLHEQYDGEGLSNDIGLVRVKTRLKFGLNVSRVALSQDLRPFTTDQEAIVAGWGVKENDMLSDRLKFTTQYVWKNKECVTMLGHMNEGAICASSDDGYAAEGDSGSGLVINGYLQIGIVSYKTMLYESVIVYTNTGYYYKWIKKEAMKLMCIK